MKVILSILIVIFVVAVFFISNKYIDIINTQNAIHSDYEKLDTKMDSISERLDKVTETLEKEEVAKKEKEKKDIEKEEITKKEIEAKDKETKDELDKKIDQLEKKVRESSQNPNRSSVSRRQPDKNSDTKNVGAKNVGTKSLGTKSLGTFSSTAYCGCTICCGPNAKGITATGTRVKAGRTIAVDPKVIPLGSKVLVNGKQYIAEDTGSAIKGNIVDVYFDDHNTALAWGRKNVDVQIIK